MISLIMYGSTNDTYIHASASNSFKANTSLHGESFPIGWLHHVIRAAVTHTACRLSNEELSVLFRAVLMKQLTG